MSEIGRNEEMDLDDHRVMKSKWMVLSQCCYLLPRYHAEYRQLEAEAVEAGSFLDLRRTTKVCAKAAST